MGMMRMLFMVLLQSAIGGGDSTCKFSSTGPLVIEEEIGLEINPGVDSFYPLIDSPRRLYEVFTLRRATGLKDAIELAVRVFALTALPVFRRYPSVRDQIERSSMSISNNVAEGFERGTTQETLTFLYIARGSSGETRSVLCLCERLPGLGDLKSEISDLRSQKVP
jgi:four helix bundle protein